MSSVINLLSAELGLRDLDVRKLCLSAPARYKVFYIDKATGGRREIAQPAPEVKRIQRLAMQIVLARFPVHSSATAYRSGVGLADNVRPHAGSGPILKMDFKNFFPSIRGRDWLAYCREGASIIEEDDARVLESLFFRRPKNSRVLRLAVGAPSSPLISNILMYKFDELVFNRVSNDYVTYTRYADDLTFSAPRVGYLKSVKSIVARSVRDLPFPKLEIHPDKTTLVTSKYGRFVTGLTLANDGRVTIGRDRKRIISSGVHRCLTGRLSEPELEKLSGLIAFVNAVEPEFLDVLRRRYGAEVVSILMRVKPRHQWREAH